VVNGGRVMAVSDLYQAYYTKSNVIVNYMSKMLCVQPGMRVLEPSAGDGVFIDSLVEKTPGLQIDAYELDPNAVAFLKKKYADDKNIHIKFSDTIVDEELTFFSTMGGIYDRVIGNPPYGAWQDYEKRKGLKKIYSNIYVKETYALFLFRCINSLVDKGKLVFIIPDTFLNLHMHTGLREYLLVNTKIKEIALFSSSFFPHVNFGYSNLSIITVEKSCNKDECLNNTVKILSGFRKIEELESPEKYGKVNFFLQGEIYAQSNHAFFISTNIVSTMINNSHLIVGDVANCVTGIYSGNDKKNLKPVSPDIKNSKNYSLLDMNLICRDYLSRSDILSGIEAAECFIPIVKGGNVKYLKPNSWYIDWSVEAVTHYKTDKKARFQNASYYFKDGIGIPMVSSTQVTASLIENRLFDQSIVGIFPHDPEMIYYLLAFFNSPTCNRLLRTINPSANNSANYVKKIPLIIPDAEMLSVVNLEMLELIAEIRENGKYDLKREVSINERIKHIYGF
jgi:phospholipid N-methyltransferase